MVYRNTLSTPWGVLILVSDRNILKSVQWDKKNPVKSNIQGQEKQHDSSSACPVLAETNRQLTAYIAGDLTNFSLPLEPAHTDHSCRFREVINTVPYGKIITYQELGAEIGSASRAAGQACKHNPFSIIIPCHRVIKTGGNYGEYGGGQEAKKALIMFEHANSRKFSKS